MRRALLLSVVLLAGCSSEAPRGPKLAACEPTLEADPPATLYLTGDDAHPDAEVGGPGRDTKTVASLDAGVVAQCTSPDGRYVSIVTHDHAAEQSLDEPWDVWIVDLEDADAERVLHVEGDVRSVDDDLSSWHEAYVPGFSVDGDQLVVANLKETEVSDGSDEPRSDWDPSWSTIDVESGDRERVADDSYDLDELFSR